LKFWQKFSLPLLLLFIAGVFYTFVFLKILPYPLRFDDEGFYIRDAVWLMEIAELNGVWATVKAYILKDYAFTALSHGPNSNLSFMAALSFLALGASRATALAWNLMALCAALLAIAKFLRSDKNPGPLTWLCFLIFFLARFAFVGAGDAFDFRLDFIGVCLYGIAITFLYESLQRARGEIAQSFNVGLLFCSIAVFFRFITGAYLLLPVVFAAVFAFRKASARARKSLGVGIALVLVLGLVYAYWSYEFIHSYYLLQQNSEMEKTFRIQYFSSLSRFANLLYYPITFARQTLGSLLSLALLVLLFLYAAKIFRKRDGAELRRPDFILLVLAILCPWLILTLNYVRTEQVAAIVFFPFLLLCLRGYAYLGPKLPRHLFLYAMFASMLLWPLRIWRERSPSPDLELKSAALLHEEVSRHARTLPSPLKEANIAFLDILPDIDHNTFVAWSAERKGEIFLPEMRVTRMPYHASAEKIFDELERSYFFIVPADWSAMSTSLWPVQRDVLGLKKDIEAWLAQHSQCGTSIVWRARTYGLCRRKAWTSSL
jgi:hypothetical protein